MRTAKEYLKQVSDLGTLDLVIDDESAAELDKGLVEVRSHERSLKEIKKSINLDMKLTRDTFVAPQETAGSLGGTLLGLFGKKKLAGSYRSLSKKRVKAEKDGKLRQYELVKEHIDKVLYSLGEAKSEIEKKKMALRSLSVSNENARGVPRCSECNKRVGKTHNYCAWCGYAL